MKRMALFISVLLMTGRVWAGSVPLDITYQGTLKQGGIPATGLHNMTFRLTDVSGTTQLGSVVNLSNVNVNQGLFSVQLDFTANGTTPIDWQSVAPYIQVSIDGQTLSPTEPINSTAFALMSASVVDGSITTAKLANEAVTTPTIANQAVTAAQIATGTITGAQIAEGTIAGSQLIPGTIMGTQIATGTIQGDQIVAGSITGMQIGTATIAGTQLAPQTITGTQIANNTITATQLDPSISGYIIPSGMIAMFAGPCPSGWTSFTPLNNNPTFNSGIFPMGGTSYTGVPSGSATHTHTFTTSTNGAHNHGGTTGGMGPLGTRVVSCSGQYSQDELLQDVGTACTYDLRLTTHAHGISMDGAHNHSGTTDAAGSVPPYLAMVFCQKN